jgi:hypothetical protein
MIPSSAWGHQQASDPRRLAKVRQCESARARYPSGSGGRVALVLGAPQEPSGAVSDGAQLTCRGSLNRRQGSVYYYKLLEN